MKIGLDQLILLSLYLSASLASRERSFLHAILKFNTLSISPGNVIAESIPILLELCIDFVWQLVLLYFLLDESVDFALDSVPRLLTLRAVVVVQGQHVVVGPAIHLNRENRGLERQCLQAHLFDPRSKVKAIHWWHRVVLLAWFELVVVLARWIQA